MTAANARYGLTSPPGMRVSTRRDAPWPTTRNPTVRLSWAHASVVGAQLPAAYRLYELTVGAKNTASSFAHAIWPARKRRKSGVSRSPRENALRSSRHRLAWMWHELPIQSANGFAMNVI